MSLNGIGAGYSAAGYASSVYPGDAKGGDIQGTIQRLQRQKEEYEKQRDTAPDSSLDNRIKNLEDRIDTLKSRLKEEEQDDGKCETCENRKYQDESDDNGVSFQSATRVAPAAAEAAVRGHENEHVTRNQAKAEREGREVVYQNVVIKHGICPECGKVYVTGGETTTVTRAKPEQRFNVGLDDGTKGKGKLLNTAA